MLIGNNGVGFYNFKKELVEALAAGGYEVHFAAPFYEKLLELKECGAIYHEIQVDRRGINPIKDLSLMRSLKGLLKEVRPDILILHTIKPNIYGGWIASRMGIPYINNITGLGSALQKNTGLAKVLRAMYKVSLKKSHGIVFENKGNLFYFQQYGIGEEKRYAICAGAGVNTDFYMRKEESGHADTVFLFIGRIMKEKGVEEYLYAAKQLKMSEQGQKVRFQMLGGMEEPRYAERIQQYAQEGILEYLGESKDTRREMAFADCIVLPSYHEGMSNVLLEGASFGLPLIASDINGCKEAIEDGITGFLCIPQDGESLLGAIKRFLNLPAEKRAEMGRLGREKMIKEFDRKKVIAVYENCIMDAIGGPHEKSAETRV